jgi:transposase
LRQHKLQGKNRSNVHQAAHLTLKGREPLIKRLERGEHCEDVACAMGVSVQTVYKWRRRYREEGLNGL